MMNVLRYSRAVALLIGSAWLLPACQSGTSQHALIEFQGATMGTTYSVKVMAVQRQEVATVSAEVAAEVDQSANRELITAS